MYILAHLIVGLLLGIALWRIVGDKGAIIVCALGAVLPDLIDKPVGHILLKGTVDYGRIYFHGVAILLLLVIVGLWFWRYRQSFVPLILAIGIFSHQFLDGMWRHPVEWLYPALGPYPKHDYPDYFLNALWGELTSPTEWIFFITAACAFGYLYRAEIRELLHRFGPCPRWSLLLIIIPLVLLSVCCAVIILTK